MQIHGLAVVKNECDIIRESLEAASNWCDYIYVFDNGSTDGTWESVLALSRQYECIVPYKQDDCVFQPSLRSHIFNHYRHKARVGDWWCRLDADEFYIDDPRTFLANVPEKYEVVWCASFQYYFTDKDYEQYIKDPSLYDDDRPVHEKCRYYLNNWSERRFLRHREDIDWDLADSWPKELGLAYPHRIRLKHYQWRSPQQIQKRLDVRLDVVRKGGKSFRHERAANWKNRVFDKSLERDYFVAEKGLAWTDRIVDSTQLNYDALDGNYVMRKDLMPRIKGGGASAVSRGIGYVKNKLFRMSSNKSDVNRKAKHEGRGVQ